MENTYQLGENMETDWLHHGFTDKSTLCFDKFKLLKFFLCTAGPFKRIPVSAVTEILKDVLTTYLQEEKYEMEWSQKMTKTTSEVKMSLKAEPFTTLKYALHPLSMLKLCGRVFQVIRARVKDLLIPRYKFVVLVHIGQLCDQSMQISSRCLWDSANDTFATYSFKNSSLFGVGTVYAVYFE